MDENLNFNPQIFSLSAKLSKALFLFNKIKNLLPLKALRNLYFAYLQSYSTLIPAILPLAQ